MSGTTSPQSGTTTTTGERAFVSLAVSLFDAAEAQAMDAYLKLRSFMSGNASLQAMFHSAAAGHGSADDDLFDRVREKVVGMDMRAIVRQVIMPLAGGYLGYAAAIALELTGGLPILIGLLVGAIIWLTLAPGSWQMVKQRLTAALEDIFGSFSAAS